MAATDSKPVTPFVPKAAPGLRSAVPALGVIWRFRWSLSRWRKHWMWEPFHCSWSVRCAPIRPRLWLSTRSVSPYRKDYISDDDSVKTLLAMAHSSTKSLSGRLNQLNMERSSLYRTHCCVAHAPGKGVAHSLIEFAKKWALSRRSLAYD